MRGLPCKVGQPLTYGGTVFIKLYKTHCCCFKQGIVIVILILSRICNNVLQAIFLEQFNDQSTVGRLELQSYYEFAVCQCEKCLSLLCLFSY